MRDLLRDGRYAFRLLRKTPVFTSAAIATLALGIGANTAIFSLSDATVLRPLHVADVDRLVAFSWTSSYPDYQAYATRDEAFTGLLAASSGGRVNVAVNGVTELARTAFVSGNAFAVLGVPPAAGRTLLPSDDVMNGPIVAVLSHDYWRARFGADPGVVGSVVRSHNTPVTIVGVAAPGFRGTSLLSNPQMYLPLTAVPVIQGGFFARAPAFTSSGLVWLTLIGRLRDGVTIDQASGFVNAFYRQLHPAPPGETPDALPSLMPLRTRALGGANAVSIRRFVVLLSGVVGLTLLIGCANLANLLLARAAARRRELGVRLALGARPAQVVRQMLVESIMLAAAGGATGLVVARGLLEVLRSYQLPGGVEIGTLALGVSGTPLAVTAALSLLTGLLFGAGPAWRAARTDVLVTLRGDARAASARSGLRSALVGAQVALSLVLLAGSGMFLRSLVRALDMPTGFDANGVAVASVNLGVARYDAGRATVFYETALERVRRLPGVTAAAWATLIPVNGFMRSVAEIEGYTKQADEEITLYSADVGTEYFRVTRTRLLEGREFFTRDRFGAENVAIVNRTLAQRYFAGRSALGGRIKPFRGDWLTVIGVVEDTVVVELGERPLPYVYRAFDQSLARGNSLTLEAAHLFVRAGDAEAVLPLIRDQLRSVDPALPVHALQPLAYHVRELLMPQRMGVTLFGLFSALALTLATIGIYGVASVVATLRTREIGIRIALGADRRAIAQLIVRQAALPAVAGMAAGLLLALWAAPFARTFLHGISPLDPAALGTAVMLIGAMTLVAIYVPARRASRLDPVAALRHE
jgi:predicted permease